MTNDSTARHWRHDVLQAVLVVARRRTLVVAIVIVTIAAGYLRASFQAPFYEASATIVLLPREKPIFDLTVQSESVETSEDAAKRSESASLTLPPNPELYTALIRSMEVLETVVQRIQAMPEFRNLNLTPRDVSSGVRLDATDEGVIRIGMSHVNPALSAAIVNGLVDECRSASKAIERQLMVQQAGFLSDATARAEQMLEEARHAVAQFAEELGVSDPIVAGHRSATLIRTLDDTEARLMHDLQRLQVHRTTEDPAVKALLGQIAEVRTQKSNIRTHYCGELSESEFSLVERRWEALLQEVTLRQDLLMSMRARNEMFSIRANQPAGNIAVIRAARIPEVPAGPSRRKAMVIAGLLSIILAIVPCIILDQIQRIRHDSEAYAMFASIVRALTARPTLAGAGSNENVSEEGTS